MQFRQLMFIALALAMAGASPARAQDSLLQSLAAEALARNPTLAQRQAAVRAATLRIRPAGTLPDPRLSLGVLDLQMPHFEFNQSDFTEVDAELSQEIPWPGSLGARSAVARAAANGMRAEENVSRREVTVALAAAYYRLQYAVTALETIQRQRELLDAAVQLTMTRYASGTATQSDPLQAKLARDRLQLEEYALESERVGALAAVNALRRHAPRDSVPVTAIDLAAVRSAAVPVSSADSLVALALAAHPRLVAQRAAVDLSRLLLRLRGRAAPDLGVAQAESAR